MHRQHLITTGKTHPHINLAGQYEFWKSIQYKQYIAKYGYHFNEHTLQCALSKITNKNGLAHSWCLSEVESVFTKHKLTIPEGCTICDVAYLVNKLYSLYFGKIIKSELDIMLLAVEYLTCPRWYSEKIFSDWLNERMFTGCVIDWEQML